MLRVNFSYPRVQIKSPLDVTAVAAHSPSPKLKCSSVVTTPEDVSYVDTGTSCWVCELQIKKLKQLSKIKSQFECQNLDKAMIGNPLAPLVPLKQCVVLWHAYT